MAQRGASYFEQSPVTTFVLAVCGVVYVLTAVYTMRMATAGESRGDYWDIDIEVLKAYGASWRPGVWDDQWQRFVMPMFLHGGLLHIGFNGYTLFQMGPRTERHYGSYNYGSILFLSGIGGICFSLIFGGYVSVGASGVLFGLLGAELAVHVIGSWDFQRMLKNSDVRQTFFFIVFLFCVMLLVDHIDHWCHLGGLVTGFLYGALFEYWKKHFRIGLGLLILALSVTVGLVVASRWMVFNPHYHIHAFLRADAEGRTEDAAHYYEEALSRASWGRSQPAAEELDDAYREALKAMDLERMQKIERLYALYVPLKRRR